MPDRSAEVVARLPLERLLEEVEEFVGWWDLHREGSVNAAYDYIDKCTKRLRGLSDELAACLGAPQEQVPKEDQSRMDTKAQPVDSLTAPANELGFNELRDINKLRCETAFHSVDAWKPWEWSNAMAGECGEACNVTKKMNRIWPANQFKQNWNKPEDQRMAELEDKLADEIADVVIYADLLATRIGRSLGECVRQKFNSKSDEIGSPIKLGAAVLPPSPQDKPEDLGTRMDRQPGLTVSVPQPAQGDK